MQFSHIAAIVVRQAYLIRGSFSRVLPLFVCEGANVRREVSSMPGVFNLSVDEAAREAAAARQDGVRGVLLFGLPERKDDIGSLAYDPEAPVQSAVRAIKMGAFDFVEKPLSLEKTVLVVRNALRYTPEGTAVEFALQSEHDAARITVRDHGPGVPADALADIFRPFYRIATARDRRSGGAGLGLAITERAVRAHGGTITAANAPDGGLAVDIRLPVVDNV